MKNITLLISLPFSLKLYIIYHLWSVDKFFMDSYGYEFSAKYGSAKKSSIYVNKLVLYILKSKLKNNASFILYVYHKAINQLLCVF